MPILFTLFYTFPPVSQFIVLSQLTALASIIGLLDGTKEWDEITKTNKTKRRYDKSLTTAMCDSR